MSPKGVEHYNGETPPLNRRECIHQCRRKALSTQWWPVCWPQRSAVHPSMSPKGVEHYEMLSDGKARNLDECIHQCRRKALSTSKSEHPRLGEVCASINVAERR